MNIDQSIVSFLNGLVTKGIGLSGMTVFFVEYFPYLLAALFVIFVFWQLRERKTQWKCFFEAAAATLLSRLVFVEGIRLFVHRLRPFAADSSILPLFSESSFSFPSGHAAFFFALSTVMFAYDRVWGWWFFVGSAIIGLARVVAGVHYPSDILAGALLGIAVGYLVKSVDIRCPQK